LTPRRSCERVKTNRRDAAKLAKLYRAGELTLIAVPDAAHEALRDLVRVWQSRRHGTTSARRKKERYSSHRRRGQPTALADIARRCDTRLHRRFHRLTSRGKPSNIAVVAVARELVGFIWAIGQQFDLSNAKTIS